MIVDSRKFRSGRLGNQRAFLSFLFVFATLASCVTTPSQPTPYQSKLDPLALQQMQTQEFETSKKILFASTISVFQDSGFVVETGDFETGLVTAKSPTTTGKSGSYYWMELKSGATMEERATAFVEDSRNGYARIRLNFIVRNVSNVTTDIPIEDPAYYEKIFNKIREAVFLREAYKATPAAK